MQGLAITDTTEENFLSFDLFDILTQIGDSIEDSEWVISEVECFGEAADEIDRLAESQSKVSGIKLLKLASNLTQTIDGIFTGYCLGGETPWIIIQAIDSSEYEVFSTDRKLLDRIHDRFRCVTQILDNKQEKNRNDSDLTISVIGARPQPDEIDLKSGLLGRVVGISSKINVENIPTSELSTFAISEIPDEILKEANRNARKAYLRTIVKYGYLSQKQAEAILNSSVV